MRSLALKTVKAVVYQSVQQLPELLDWLLKTLGLVTKNKLLIGSKEGIWRKKMQKKRENKSCYGIDSILLVRSSFYAKLFAFPQKHG